MKLLPGEGYYENWDNDLNPAMFIQKKLETTASSTNDTRGYNSKIIDYLIKNSAVLLEEHSRLDAKKAEKRDGEFSYYADKKGNRIYFYKNHVIKLQRGYDEEWAVEDWYSTGDSSILGEFKPFLIEEKESKVSVLLQGAHGMTVKEIDFDPPVIKDLELNYGTGFGKIHERIVAKLSEKKSSLIALHGEMGSGKSNYLKYLSSIIGREFIFIPIGLASELASPAFLNILMEHKNSVLILEDAEQALKSRELNEHNSSTVSSILNITDGVLGQILAITIIASWNAKESFIDKALLRKGRLAFDYTFEKLSVSDARRMAESLGKKIDIKEPMSLADIYNAEDNTNYKEPVKRSMGFGG